MTRFSQQRLLSATSVFLICFAAPVFAETFVAGSTPSQRPADSPVISEFQKSAEWQAQALKGVTEPYPKSLDFLKDQGAWYTPFTRPNMPPPYDLRGLYRQGAEQ